MQRGQDDSIEGEVQADEDITVEDNEGLPWESVDVSKYLVDDRYDPRGEGEFTLREFMDMAHDIRRHVSEVQARRILGDAVREGKMTVRVWVNDKGKLTNLYKEV